MGRSKNKKSKGKPKSKNDSPKLKSLEDDDCSPIKVHESAIYGRFLVASRNIDPGEKILEELPLVVAPSQDTKAVCIGCYQKLNYSTSKRCEECGFPLCSVGCTGIGQPTGHSQWECELLARSDVRTISATTLQNSLEAIGPLRCLALRSYSPDQWQILNSMETHTEERQQVTSLWAGNQRNVVDVIRLQWGLNQFDEELIHQMCGVLEVNAFEVGNNLRAVYPTAYLFAHNCTPNTRHSDSKDFQITFRATQPIKTNESLFVTYTYILQGTRKRRDHLRKTKFFECQCKRCSDPTECGTNMSALKCPKCTHGVMNSCAPLSFTTNWKCQRCQNSIDGEEVNKLMDRIYEELDITDGNDVKGYESFLKKYSTVLDDNHYLSISALHCLYQLYGKIEGYLINDLTEAQLQRKVDICRILLDTFNTLEPGFTKQRGLLQYELHAPLMVLLQRSYLERKLGKKELKDKLREVVKCLEDAKKLLKDEPAGSEAAQLATAAEQALDNLENWKDMLNRM